MGLSDAYIKAVLLSADSALFNDTERAVLSFTDALVRQVKAPDALYARLAELIAPQWQLELVMTIGFYMLVSRLLEKFEVELESQDVDMLEMPRG